MSHYQERLEKDLASIRREVVDVGKKVSRAVGDAVHALLTQDRELAYRTVLGDHPINRQVRRLDRECHAFVARHLPSAGHLRFVSATLRLNIALERIGDYAVGIARETAQLEDPLPAPVARDLEMLASQTGHMLSQAVKSWDEGNADLARGTMGMAAQLGAAYRRVFSDLLDAGEQGSHALKDLFAWLAVFNRLSRVGDQAKNVCEDVLFAVAGETKKPKVYRILFVDETDDCFTQMAVAYARKVYPKSGRYASAGWRPAAALEPRCAVFLDKSGYDTRDLEPSAFDLTFEELADVHVVVTFGDSLNEHVERLPFHTIALDWEVGERPGEIDQERAEELYAQAQHEIGHRVRELMETLRGEEAD